MNNTKMTKEKAILKIKDEIELINKVKTKFKSSSLFFGRDLQNVSKARQKTT